jgi:hypothetical protein
MKKIIILISLILFLLMGISLYSQEQFPPTTQGQSREKSVQNATPSDISPANYNNDSKQTGEIVINAKAPHSNQSLNKGNHNKTSKKPPNNWNNWISDPIKFFYVLPCCMQYRFVVDLYILGTRNKQSC